MKRLLSIAVLICTVFGAWAQNNYRMTEEEKRKTLEDLEFKFQMEIGSLFNREDPAEVLNIMPWDRWAYKYRNEYPGLSDLFSCLEKLSVEPVENEPKMCRLVFRGKVKGSDNFHSREYLGSIIGSMDETYTDSNGGYIRFRNKIFYDLVTDIELNLKDKNGEPVYIDPYNETYDEGIFSIEGKKSTGNGESDVWFGIEIPLTSEFSEISSGTANVRFIMPDEYDIVKINPDDVCDKPVHISFGDLNFNVEKADSAGFVISADIIIKDKISQIRHLYKKDDIWYEPHPSMNEWEALEKVLEYDGGNYTFEKWMEKNGIDPENLEKTLLEYKRRINSPGYGYADIFGRYYKTGVYADTILFYNPAGPESERVLSESSVEFTPTESKASCNPDRILCNGILDKLKLMQKKAEEEEEGDEYDSKGLPIWESLFEDEPDVKETKDTAVNMKIEENMAAKVQFPQPGDKTGNLNPIVYGLCYTTAYNMLSRNSVKVKTYRKEYAPYIHAGYDFGVKHWKELILEDFSSLRQQLQGIEDITGLERSSFRSGALMGAYSTSSGPDLEYIDASISEVLKQVRSSIHAENETSRQFYSLYNKWLDFVYNERARYYDIAMHDVPYYMGQEYADDALILPEWIDSAAVSNGVADSEVLASAIAKFDVPAAPDGIRKLKADMLLTPEERNVLLAPNDMISYAVGVAQAEWIMQYKWFIGEVHRADFDAMLLPPESRPAVIAAFENGLRSAMAITERFRNAILSQDSDSICLMNKDMKTELNKAYGQGPVYGYVFMNGMDAVDIYRTGAEWDIPEKQLASGLRLDTEKVLEGFRDYMNGHLKMGVVYAWTLTKGRNAIDWHLYEEDTEAVNLSENDLRPVTPISIETGTPSEWEAILSQMIETRQEVKEQALSGRVKAAVIIEADGSVSKVEITSSPHPVLSETVMDCIYRMKFIPAKYNGDCVAFVAIIPVLF